MKELTHIAGAAALVFSLSAVTSVGQGLNDDKEVERRLLVAAVGNEIKDNCPTIEVRTIAATFFVLGIVTYAKGEGYSLDEIDAYRHDPVQQEKLRVATYAYLDSHGVNREDPQSYCPLGQAEIKQGSEIGKLIKNK